MKRFASILLLLATLSVGAQTPTPSPGVGAIANFPFNFQSPSTTTAQVLIWDPAANGTGLGAVRLSTISTGLTYTGGGTNALTAAGGGGGTPGGSTTQVQYNNAAAFAGAAGFTFNGTAKITLGVAGTSIGSIDFKNQTSGTLTLAPDTSALGTTLLTLPPGNGTVARLADISDANLNRTDITTNNVSTSFHGFAPKGDGNSAHFLNGNGGYTTPAGGGSGTVTNSTTLTSNAVVLGNGTVDTKVVAGITTDGSSQLTLGANTTAASLRIYNAGNWATSLVAGSDTQTYTVTLPAKTTTLSGTDTTDSLTNKTFTGTNNIVDSNGLKFNSTGNAAVTLKRGGASGSVFTATLPEATTTLVGTTETATLSGKTLDNPIVGGAPALTVGLRLRNAGNQDTTLMPTASGTPTITFPSVTTTLLGTADLGTSVGTFLGTPSSANLRTAVTDETGTGGALVFATAPQISTIELGDPADTTLSRSSAGVLAVEGVAVPTISSTSTLTNKRVTPRVDASTSASATTWAPNSDTTDVFELAGVLTVAVTTISNPSGTPTDFQRLSMRIKSDGSAHALTWNGSQWRGSSDLALPTTTTASKTLYLLFRYNSTDTKWDLLALLDNF